MFKIVVMVSGGGTNLQAIIDAVQRGKNAGDDELTASQVYFKSVGEMAQGLREEPEFQNPPVIDRQVEIAAVISNNRDAYALERARKAGIEALCISPKDYETRDDFHDALIAKLDEIDPQLIVLAGYLVVIPPKMVQHFRGKIINIHPSLIPSFCGKGYYGLKVHEGVVNRGVKVTGATVHYVDEGTDTGPILLQKAVYVTPGNDPAALQKRVMEHAEWLLLPTAIDMIALGRERFD